MLASPLVTCQCAVIVQSIGTEVCVHVCVRVAGAELNVSACRVIERNLISSSQPPPPPASVRPRNVGHINHRKVLLGERSASTLCQNSIQASVRTPLYPWQTYPEPQTRPPVQFLNLPLANLSFLVFQQESNNLIPGAFLAPPPAFLQIFPSMLSALCSLSLFSPPSNQILHTPSAYDW